jgi:hypothetical protein
VLSTKVLTEGFDVALLKAHFRDPGKQPSIRRMLHGYPRIENYTDADVEAFAPLFFGYSLYEVDGVFHSPRQGIVEERTQVVRFLLKPDFDWIIEGCGAGPERRNEVVALCREFLRGPSLEGAEFIRHEKHHLDERYHSTLPNYSRIIAYFDTWMNQVRMFIFGYVVHELCERMLQLHREEKLTAEQLEEEIWVASFSNLAVNRVTRSS